MKEAKTIREREIRWYLKHGKYRDRIRLDSCLKPYVIGDWSWNHLYPTRREFIEPQMKGQRRPGCLSDKDFVSLVKQYYATPR